MLKFYYMMNVYYIFYQLEYIIHIQAVVHYYNPIRNYGSKKFHFNLYEIDLENSRLRTTLSVLYTVREGYQSSYVKGEN